MVISIQSGKQKKIDLRETERGREGGRGKGEGERIRFLAQEHFHANHPSDVRPNMRCRNNIDKDRFLRYRHANSLCISGQCTCDFRERVRRIAPRSSRATNRMLHVTHCSAHSARGYAPSIVNIAHGRRARTRCLSTSYQSLWEKSLRYVKLVIRGFLSLHDLFLSKLKRKIYSNFIFCIFTLLITILI